MRHARVVARFLRFRAAALVFLRYEGPKRASRTRCRRTFEVAGELNVTLAFSLGCVLDWAHARVFALVRPRVGSRARFRSGAP